MTVPARPYSVKSVEEIFRSEQYSVRRFTVAPGESIPWHEHPSTHDDYYMLEGRLLIELREPGEKITLSAGDTYRVQTGRPHCNSNPADEPCVFLLVQGPGPSTFTVTPDTNATAASRAPGSGRSE